MCLVRSRRGQHFPPPGGEPHGAAGRRLNRHPTSWRAHQDALTARSGDGRRSCRGHLAPRRRPHGGWDRERAKEGRCLFSASFLFGSRRGQHVLPPGGEPQGAAGRRLNRHAPPSSAHQDNLMARWGEGRRSCGGHAAPRRRPHGNWDRDRAKEGRSYYFRWRK